jgi:hypothetical protein
MAAEDRRQGARQLKGAVNMRRLMALLALIIGVGVAGATDLSELHQFREARRRWGAIESRLADKRQVTSGELGSAAEQLLAVFSKLSESDKAAYRDHLNRVWITQAWVLAAEGKYERALEKLDQEMLYQYERGGGKYLSGQNRTFLRNVVILEADILGHLGRGYYPRGIDHFLVPADVNGDGVDEFIAMERTREDVESSVTIPALPAGNERQIVYLIARGTADKYSIIASVQVIGEPDQRDTIAVEETSNGVVTVMHNVSHTMELNEDGIPRRYVRRDNPTVRFRVTLNGFEEIHDGRVGNAGPP